MMSFGKTKNCVKSIYFLFFYVFPECSSCLLVINLEEGLTANNTHYLYMYLLIILMSKH